MKTLNDGCRILVIGAAADLAMLERLASHNAITVFTMTDEPVTPNQPVMAELSLIDRLCDLRPQGRVIGLTLPLTRLEHDIKLLDKAALPRKGRGTPEAFRHTPRSPRDSVRLHGKNGRSAYTGSTSGGTRRK